MKVLSLALLYLGSVSFFGVEAAKLDVASDFKRKWSSWRAQRDESVALTAAQAAALGGSKRPAGSQAATEEKPALTAAQAAAGAKRPARSLDSSSSLRARRSYLNSGPLEVHLQYLRERCGFGTCTVHNLAHLIHHYLDKDKDVSAPPVKFGPQGYGRRRRRSLLAAAAAAASSSSSSSRSTRTASRLLASLREGGSAARALAQP